MREWMPTDEELAADFDMMVAAHGAFNIVHGATFEEGRVWMTAFNVSSSAEATPEQRDEARRLMAAIDAALLFRNGAEAPSARIAFHDATQDAVRIISPTHRFIWQLMAGGFTRRVRVSREEDGRPVFEGSAEIMGPMTYEEAVEFVAWKDMPRGVNHFSVITTDDLPRIDGCIDRARKFRAAWRLKEAA